MCQASGPCCLPFELLGMHEQDKTRMRVKGPRKPAEAGGKPAVAAEAAVALGFFRCYLPDDLVLRGSHVF